MAAQVDFDIGCKPPQIVAFALGHKECGLREIILCRDRLHSWIVQPGIERAYGCGIAAEHDVGKCVDLKQPELHVVFPA